MQVRIEQVTDVKHDPQKGWSAKMVAGGQSYFVNEDATALVGRDAEIDVTEKTSAKGNKYKVAKIVRVLDAPAASNGNGHGGITWGEYRVMAKLAHELAKELEPDGEVTEDGAATDRSQARTAILNTVMIAFSNGKISLPGDDEVPW